MSVLYISWMIFSMYADGQMTYNECSHMDKSVMLAGGEDVERRRTVGEYRMIDLLMFSLMVVLGEGVICIAAGSFTGQPYVFSVVPVITAIVMMRWGPWAAIHAVLGGLAFTLFSGGGGTDYLVYGAGNLLGLGTLALLKKPGKERICADALLAMVYGVATALAMQLGRALVWMVIHRTAEGFTAFFLADVLTLLSTAVIIWIVRRLDGVFEDQIKYLLRVSKEQEEERKYTDEG